MVSSFLLVYLTSQYRFIHPILASQAFFLSLNMTILLPAEGLCPAQLLFVTTATHHLSLHADHICLLYVIFTDHAKLFITCCQPCLQSKSSAGILFYHQVPSTVPSISTYYPQISPAISQIFTCFLFWLNSSGCQALHILEYMAVFLFISSFKIYSQP